MYKQGEFEMIEIVLKMWWILIEADKLAQKLKVRSEKWRETKKEEEEVVGVAEINEKNHFLFHCDRHCKTVCDC